MDEDLNRILSRMLGESDQLKERKRCIAICDEALNDAVVSRYGSISECNVAREMAERIKRMIEEAKG